jgi:hypothetical protein
VIDEADIEDVYELSPLQQGLLFHSLLDPGSGFYVEQYSCLLEGDLDPAALERAWQEVVDSHAALRASFHWRDLDKPLQVLRRHVPVRLERKDWREAPAREVELELLMADERARGFDLTAAPLMRWSLLWLGEGRHRLVWSFHHLLLDGWSLQVVLGEVFARYDALRSSAPFAAPATRPYGDYIGWLQGQDRSAAEAFWRQALAGFRWPTRLGLCLNAIAEPATAECMDEEVWRLPAEATAAVLARAREWKVTPNALVLAAWSLLLGRYAEEREVVIGAVCSGRPPELAGVESMVGAFASTLPLRVPVEPEARVRPWLAEVQARQLRALQHQWSSLIEIQGWSEVPRGTPLFESLFMFQNAPGTASPQRSGRVALRDVRFTSRPHLPLTLEAWFGEELSLTLNYDRRRFARDGVRGALLQLGTLIEAIPRDPDARLGDLPMLGAEERHHVLVEWNATGPGRVEGPCFPAAFAAQVERTPDAPAVDDGLTRLSYRELERRSNRLARHLGEIGVRGRLVGVFLLRSTDLLVACVSALKAGAVYLPLDPGYPAARLRQVLRDSGVGVVVCDSAGSALLDGAGVRLVPLDRERSAIEAQSEAPVDARVEPEV